jgi:hypothetical protein
MAQVGGLPAPFISRTAEVWTGIDATRHSWAVYTGAAWSPLGTLDQDGLRLRFSGGYGEYRYEGASQRIYGTVTFADLLAGYQMGLGALTLKAFVGATFDGHSLLPFDAGNRVNGEATGAKGVLEAWLNLTPVAWAQLDLSYATAHESYFSRLRLGYRVTNTVSLGVEGGAFGNTASDSGRAGGFVRYEWPGGEMSVSGGVSGDIAAPRNPYGTLVYTMRF